LHVWQAAFGAPLDETVLGEFDFVGNLALFNKDKVRAGFIASLAGCHAVLQAVLLW